jgi:SWI/SNF-related matrix-associated actin-dependent regulator 1 of chromatin subfamily A
VNPIKVEKSGARWIARFAFDWATKDVVKAAGFHWDPTTKLWWTEDVLVAAKLDSSAADQANTAIASSYATGATAQVPVPNGLAYLPYQLAGIAYAASKPATLIGDEMGLGKTIEAIGVINLDTSIQTVLVVCPASLKVNWAREMNKWLVRKFSIEIANGTFPTGNIVIINYDILIKHRAAIDARKWDLLIVDECHMVKNENAQRTRILLGHEDKDPAKVVKPISAKRKIFMTGTPIVNRPKELWTLVHALDPQGLGRRFFTFMKRYTEAHHNGYGWDFNGASNLGELQQRLRSKFMVRRLKSEVMTEMPAKRRQVIILPPSTHSGTAIAAELSVYKRYRDTIEAAEEAAREARAQGDKDGYNASIRKLHGANKIAFEEMSQVRHDTAVAKIPNVIEHLKECLEAEDKVVVFVHHHDVGHALLAEFPTAAVVTGETPPNARSQQVDKFQHDPNCHLFIGSIHAAGLGLTLTAAQLVIFAELDWVPGTISQCEDRLHRIGQQGSVLVQHLVFDGSVDSIMAHTIVEKQEVIERALDARTPQVNSHAALAQVAINPRENSEGVRKATEIVYQRKLDDGIPF